MKALKFWFIAFLVGVLTNLLGFPIIVAGAVSVKAIAIIVILDTIFYLIYWNEDKK